MTDLSLDDERVVERLTVQLLQDAYVELATVLFEARPEVAAAIFGGVEQRFTDVLTRIYQQGLEGVTSQEIAISTGERISEIVDQAHGRGSRAALAA